MSVIDEKKTRQQAGYAFMSGGGELGALMRAKDWSKTLVGPVDLWPQTLKSTIHTLLRSRFAMCLWWGPHLVQFYNDAYRASLGKSDEKHPRALGSPGPETWGEAWPIIEPQIKQVIEAGVATWNVNHLVPIFRDGILAEAYWTYSYSPVYDEFEKIGGVLVTVTETTEQVFSERQLTFVEELSRTTLRARTTIEACVLTARAFQTNPRDIPFALIYLADHEKNTLTLASQARLDSYPGLIQQTAFMKDDAVWPFSKLFSEGQPIVIRCIDMPSECQSWPGSVSSAALIPIYVSGHASVRGVIVMGLNSMRLFDTGYQRFAGLISSQVSAAISYAQVYENEKKRADALAEIDRSKTFFFSNISHEFRTPLTLMLGPLQELMSSRTDEDRHRLEMVYRNGLRLQKLVNALLDFSRIEAGRFEATFMPTDLASLTAELASHFRSAIEMAGLTYRVEMDRLSEEIYVDRNLWETIVLNLLSNAFKFTFEGEIAVILKEDDTHVSLIVRDTGEGISEAHLPLIFARFKRVEGARARSTEGSGIGLSLVNELVKIHGGQIQVESKLKEGSSFTVRIPKGVRHLPPTQVRSDGEFSVNASPYVQEVQNWLMGLEDFRGRLSEEVVDLEPGLSRIVVVDDNADMRSYLGRLLHSRYRVELAASGSHAVRMVCEKHTDLVITDLMMADMDGQELISMLKSNPQTSRIPVIVLSARADQEAKLRALNVGAEDYIVKPFSAEELLARTQTIIASHRVKRETDIRLYELFMQLPAAIAVVRGRDHIFDFCNPKCFEAIGRDRRILGKSIREALPEIAQQGFVEILDKVYVSGVPFYGSDMLVQLNKMDVGRLGDYYFNLSFQPIRGVDNEVEGILIHALDVTSQVHARARIEESEAKYKALFEKLEIMVQKRTEELKRSNEDLQQFAHVASHDLKEPVRKILVFSDLLAQDHGGAITGIGRSYLTKIQRAASRMKAMIEGVLAYSSVNKMDGFLERVSLDKVVSDVKQDLELLIQERNAVVKVEPLPEVDGVEILLYQLFYNLVNNALKFSRPGVPPEVQITSELHDGPVRHVIIHVRDKGIAFDTSDAVKIFDPFIRLHSKDEFEGNGLGLALCQKIVMRHGGRISATPGNECGATFTVSLPVRRALQN